MSEAITVCGLIGSLRAESWNRRLMEAAVHAAPDDFALEVSDEIGRIPLFNEDLMADEPEAVTRLKESVAGADALLIATPEYNGGVPGVLKNALDWISLPLGRSVLHRKPVALMGASPGRLGTARGQFELRNMFVFSQSPVMPSPELLLGFAAQAFDDEGRLTDVVAHERMESLFVHLRRHVHAHRQEVAPL